MKNNFSLRALHMIQFCHTKQQKAHAHQKEKEKLVVRFV